MGGRLDFPGVWLGSQGQGNIIPCWEHRMSSKEHTMSSLLGLSLHICEGGGRGEETFVKPPIPRRPEVERF